MNSHIYFIHIDGDNFFVSCELTRFPEYRTKPVVVGQERGIAVALNTYAKQFGIVRGDPVFRIQREHPEVVILPSHFDLYQQFSSRMGEILSRHVDSVEYYSIDECFAVVRLSDPSECDSLLSRIRSEIQSELGITVSAGCAPTKLLSKVGSKTNKPNGQTCIISREERLSVLSSTPVAKLWGAGKATVATLSVLGVVTALDFAELAESVVRQRFSAPGIDMWYELNGVSRVGLVHRPHKQSMQSTRMIPIAQRGNREYVWSELSYHTEILCRRLLKDNLVTSRVDWYVSYERGDVIGGAQVVLSAPTQNPADITRVIEQQWYSDTSVARVYRSAGVTVMCSPIDSIQNDLFGYASSIVTDAPLVNTLRDLRLRFGDQCVSLASSAPSVRSRHAASLDRNIHSRYLSGLPLPYIGEVY
jgi:DNA polymerase-4